MAPLRASASRGSTGRSLSPRRAPRRRRCRFRTKTGRPCPTAPACCATSALCSSAIGAISRRAFMGFRSTSFRTRSPSGGAAGASSPIWQASRRAGAPTTTVKFSARHRRAAIRAITCKTSISRPMLISAGARPSSTTIRPRCCSAAVQTPCGGRRSSRCSASWRGAVSAHPGCSTSAAAPGVFCAR